MRKILTPRPRLGRPDRFDLTEWEALCGEATRLGLALARFDRALAAYKAARDAEGAT